MPPAGEVGGQGERTWYLYNTRFIFSGNAVELQDSVLQRVQGHPCPSALAAGGRAVGPLGWETPALPVPRGGGWRDLRGCGFNVDDTQLINVFFYIHAFRHLCKRSLHKSSSQRLCFLLEVP